jgi:integrase/recombinase XerD
LTRKRTVLLDEPLTGEILPATATTVAVVGDIQTQPPPASIEDLVRDWLIEYRSVNSRAAYWSDMNLWLGYCAASRLDPLGPPERHHVAAWLAILADHRGEKVATRARRLSAVSAWYDWLRIKQLVRSNPVDELKPELKPQWPKESPLPSLTREQAESLLAAADNYTGAAGALRAAAIVAVLLYCGLRAAGCGCPS